MPVKPSSVTSKSSVNVEAVVQAGRITVDTGRHAAVAGSEHEAGNQGGILLAPHPLNRFADQEPVGRQFRPVAQPLGDEFRQWGIGRGEFDPARSEVR